MLQIAHVVVPTDGSDLAARAFPVAQAAARWLSAQVHLVAVVNREDDRDERESMLASVGERLGVGPADRRVILAGSPAAGIDTVARELEPALVCLASHGHGRSAAVLGSVAQDVLTDLGAPVLVVGPHGEVGPAGAPVIVAVDGRADPHPLVSVAASWAERLGVTLEVVTVAEPVPEPVRPGAGYGRAHGPDIDADRYVAELAARVGAGHPSITVEGVAVYDPISPSDGLRVHLQDRAAQLVVVATHARTGLARVFVGSTTARLVHTAAVPILVVPPARS